MLIYKYGNKKWFFLTLISSLLISIKGIFTAYVVGEFINIATNGNFNDLTKMDFLGPWIWGIFSCLWWHTDAIALRVRMCDIQ